MLIRVPASPPRPTRVRRRRSVRWVVIAVVVLGLLPVPWQAKTDSGVGVAWGMDNRLLLDGVALDPPGRWSWLTAGRPTLVGELLWQRAVAVVEPDVAPVARDLRAGPAEHRPVHVEPLAAAVGLAAANGELGLDVGVEPVDAVLGGHQAPYRWLRSMSVGSSHGLMVGLVTYAAFADEDLAAGRHIAGTGTLSADGTVGPIGGLRAKITGALRAGADVLLVPSSQTHELDGVDTGDLRIIGVDTIDDAIRQLRATATTDVAAAG